MMTEEQRHRVLIDDRRAPVRRRTKDAQRATDKRADSAASGAIYKDEYAWSDEERAAAIMEAHGFVGRVVGAGSEPPRGWIELGRRLLAETSLRYEEIARLLGVEVGLLRGLSAAEWLRGVGPPPVDERMPRMYKDDQVMWGIRRGLIWALLREDRLSGREIADRAGVSIVQVRRLATEWGMLRPVMEVQTRLRFRPRDLVMAELALSNALPMGEIARRFGEGPHRLKRVLCLLGVWSLRPKVPKLRGGRGIAIQL